MSERDIAVPTQFNVPVGGTATTKPLYLISFNVSQSNTQQDFISIDLPALDGNWVKTKGTWIGHGNDVKSNDEVVKTAKSRFEDKKNITEMYFPSGTIKHIKNLMFNADKK